MSNNISRREMLKLIAAASAFPLVGGAMSSPLGGLTRVHAADAAGEFTYWIVPPDTQIERDFLVTFEKTVKEKLPNVNITTEQIAYGDMLDKLRVAVRGGGGPQVAVLPILWGVEFAANGFLKELSPADLGYKDDQFWPKAMNSVRWQGKTYGVPTNNETLAFIYNRDLFEKAKLDPGKPPKTWAEVVEFSKQINKNLGIAGFGLVAKLNNGNTPFRFMPVLWAHGGSALDELEATPTFKEVRIASPESKAAMQVYYDMYVKDKSAPKSSLDNTQTENRELFLAEQAAMMISHPNEFNIVLSKAPKLKDSVQYVLIPEGPKRRAVVFGGSNIHILNTIEDGSLEGAKEFIKLRTNPEWANRLAWFSNPGNRDGFKDPAYEERQKQIKFLEVSTAMLEFGLPFPVVPEATEIMNLIVPTMLHNFMTGTMTIDQAAADAEKQIKDLLARANR